MYQRYLFEETILINFSSCIKEIVESQIGIQITVQCTIKYTNKPLMALQFIASATALQMAINTRIHNKHLTIGTCIFDVVYKTVGIRTNVVI